MRRSHVFALFTVFAAISVFIVVMAFVGKNPKQTIASPTATNPVAVLPTATLPPETTGAPTALPTEAPTAEPTEEPGPTPVARPVINPSDFSNYSTKVTSWGISGTYETDGDMESMKYTIDTSALAQAEGADYIYRVADGPEKTVYLTFILGYEESSKPTLKILDKLGEAGVKATFFISKNYFEDNEDIVRAIYEQGHTIGTRGDLFIKGDGGNGMAYIGTAEFSDVMWSIEQLYQEIAGENSRMVLYRPSQFSKRDLALSEALGYTAVFYSFDYYDWDDSVDTNKALQKLKNNTASGAIYQLSSSKVNAAIIDDYIVWAKDQGYGFAALDSIGLN